MDLPAARILMGEVTQRKNTSGDFGTHFRVFHYGLCACALSEVLEEECMEFLASGERANIHTNQQLARARRSPKKPTIAV